MQINLFVILVVSCFASFTWSVPLVPKTCFPCIFTSNRLRSRIDNTLDTFMDIAARSDVSKNLDDSYLVNMASLREQAKSAAIASVAGLRRIVRCRHARAAEARGDGHSTKTKRRVSPDLALCHFKICNMGRKRTSRFVHTVNAIVHED